MNEEEPEAVHHTIAGRGASDYSLANYGKARVNGDQPPRAKETAWAGLGRRSRASVAAMWRRATGREDYPGCD
jgi:hypothetical protein